MPSLEQQRAAKRSAAPQRKQQQRQPPDQEERPEEVARDFATASSSMSFRAHAGANSTTTRTQNSNSVGSKLKRSASELRRAEGFWSHLDDSPLARLDVAISRVIFSCNLGYAEVSETASLLPSSTRTLIAPRAVH